MKITKVTKLSFKPDQYDISTSTENFYVALGNRGLLVHNSPSTITGINPENGQFFVATKGAFSKNPKLCYTVQDVNKYYGASPGLAKKLKLALQEFPKLGIKGVLQGDFLFDKSNLKKETLAGETCITFKPNTITYAVPINSNLARIIMSAKVGIVFHTTYVGDSIASMKASFGANVSSLQKTTSVWCKNADYEDVSGTATLTAAETKDIETSIARAYNLLALLDSSVVFELVNNSELNALIQQFTNSMVRGGSLPNSAKYVKDLTNFISAAYDKAIAALKTDKGKMSRQEKYKDLVRFIKSNSKTLTQIVDLQNLLSDIKLKLIRKLETANNIGTFLQTPNGFQVTAPEGFVAADHLGNAVKLVDRLSFSRANFTIPKSW